MVGGSVLVGKFIFGFMLTWLAAWQLYEAYAHGRIMGRGSDSYRQTDPVPFRVGLILYSVALMVGVWILGSAAANL